MESGIMEQSSGIDTVAIAGELTRMKAYKHTFPGYEYDDISQEMWMMVQEASGRFDPTRAKRVLTFFNVHTENRLNNLKRDNKKLSRDKPTAHDGPVIKIDNSFTEDVELNDLITFMEREMPSQLRESFDCMWYHGGVGLTSYMKKNVRDTVKRLLRLYNRENNHE